MQLPVSPQEKRPLRAPCLGAPPQPRSLPLFLRTPTATARPLRSLLPPQAISQDPPPEETSPSRGCYPVQLRVYNIDRWGLAPVGGKLLKKEVDGIYHVAVSVHGFEYWFDHRVEKLNLNDVFYVRGFSPAFLYDMGVTSMEPDETEAFCFGALREKYNIDTYDVFYHNCHHFARDLSMKLTKRKIPQWLIDHGEQGLSELPEENAKLVRMVSNKIARIMMLSWGRYSKKRFVEKRKSAQSGASLSALDPTPLAGRSPFFVDAQPTGVSNEGLRRILPEHLLRLEKEGQDA